MRIKKGKISMRTRRTIFLLCFGFILGVIITSCISGIVKLKNNTPVQVNAEGADTVSTLLAPTAKASRYGEIEISQEEKNEIAAIVYLEARNQSVKGQQAVAEVILNRVLSDDFPDTVRDVIHEGESKGIVQFTTVYAIDKAEPTEKQFSAIEEALYGEPVLPLDVVFFSRKGENKKVWGKIDDHVFCYGYDWE